MIRLFLSVICLMAVGGLDDSLPFLEFATYAAALSFVSLMMFLSAVNDGALDEE